MIKKNKTRGRRAALFFSGLLSASMLASGAWADPFTDALVATYQNNPELKAQREQLRATDEQMPQALSGFMPSAGITYQDGKQHTQFNDSPEESTDTQTKRLTVTQPLFKGGQTLSGVSRARHLVKGGRADLQTAEQGVLLQAITAYMDVIRDRSVVELSKNNVEVLSKQLEAAEERFAVGEVTRTDVAQSEARLSRAQSELVQARGTLEGAEAAFEKVIGYAPGGNVKAPEKLPELPPTLEKAVEMGLQDNPTITSAHHQERSADKDTNILIGRLLPDISLQGTMSRQEGVGLAGNADFDEDQLVLNANIPLYQSGAEYSRIRAAKATASQRKFELLNQQNDVRKQVTQAWETLQAAIAAIKSDQDAVRAAEIALDGVEQEHLYGSRTVLDVLDAEQELFVAKVNLVRVQRDRVVALYRLLSAVGKLTAQDLGVPAEVYDPKANYNSVKYQFIGF